jgi:pimeloyl-ACP methyl ester carboxylesterase/DNA-binding CsgD family transcriptional regulator
VHQTIRFARNADGVRLAYAESGPGVPRGEGRSGGLPIVKAANWLSHLEFDWQSPVWRHWFSFLSSRNRLIRYDTRGCGLSDWDVEDLTLAAQVTDLETVIDAAGVDRFVLVGISQGGAVAIEYVLRHPERVSQLVLYGAFARGWNRRSDAGARQFQALNDLVRFGWGQDNPAFRKLFANLFIPEANEEQEQWFADLMRITSRPEMAARIMEASAEIDVVDKLRSVRVPTLVIHGRNDGRVPFSEGRTFASNIPDAQFVALESRNHILLETEPAWGRFCAAFDQFVSGTAGQSTASAAPALNAPLLDQLTDRERAILGHLAHGLSNAEIAERVFISEKTVRNHLTSIFSKLDVDSRAKAIVLAHQSGGGR